MITFNMLIKHSKLSPKKIIPWSRSSVWAVCLRLKNSLHPMWLRQWVPSPAEYWWLRTVWTMALQLCSKHATNHTLMFFYGTAAGSDWYRISIGQVGNLSLALPLEHTHTQVIAIYRCNDLEQVTMSIRCGLVLFLLQICVYNSKRRRSGTWGKIMCKQN